MKLRAVLCLLLVVSTFALPQSQTVTQPKGIPPGSHVFIESMDGFETYLSAAILKEKVSLVITDDKDNANYIISGTSHVQPAGWAKTIFIAIKDAKTDDLLFAYSLDKFNAARASQSTAEACAKHMKEPMAK